ncbi:MAG: hypothetical protein R3A47_12040 [Polyangiales bacterium]
MTLYGNTGGMVGTGLWLVLVPLAWFVLRKFFGVNYVRSNPRQWSSSSGWYGGGGWPGGRDGWSGGSGGGWSGGGGGFGGGGASGGW